MVVVVGVFVSVIVTVARGHMLAMMNSCLLLTFQCLLLFDVAV